MNETYQPIPVGAAQAMAEQFQKSQVIIISYDRAHQTGHFTTYGVSAEDKIQAAKLGDHFLRMLGKGSKSIEFEDFRHLDAAMATAKIDGLRKALLVNFVFLKAITEKLGIGEDTSIKVELNEVNLGVYTLAQAEDLARQALGDMRPVRVHEMEPKPALES